ncbi:hypothetical protein FG386_000375 [Cryptosporidium ryanae]|uniref:uncharacterized protein n=1 Tax=Cryptosporidium ryanae TaxID=515981 RepID=UPI00351A5452|nr:hypothetical protein FG386_000375 [Cryptosporidium ryanae]
MGVDSDVLSDNELFIKSRLEVKLNDLEKRHLETKEREAQTVGFLERRLKQVELEHKMELKLRRQLRYEVNNLRKKLLETYKLYSDTLEQNEKIKRELEMLRSRRNKGEGAVNVKLSISREVSLMIKTDDYELAGRVPASLHLGSENERGTNRNRSSFITPNNSSRTRAFFTPIESRVRHDKHGFVGSGGYIEKSLTRNTGMCDSASCGFRGEGLNYSQKDSLVKSERAQDWLDQIEELYKHSEIQAGGGKHREEKRKTDNFVSVLRVEDSLDVLEDVSSEDRYFSGEDKTDGNDFEEDLNFDDFVVCLGRREGLNRKGSKYSADSPEVMATNTELIINQINQQDKELSSLLRKTNICNSYNVKNRVNMRRINRDSGNKYK